MKQTTIDFFIRYNGTRTGVTILYLSNCVDFLVHLNSQASVTLYRKELADNQKIWATRQEAPAELSIKLGSLIDDYLRSQA